MAHENRVMEGIPNDEDYMDQGITSSLNKTKTRDTDILKHTSTFQIKM